MSLRPCLTAFSRLSETLRPSTIQYLNVSCQNVARRSQVMWFTTKTNPRISEQNQIKEIYYGILTPQVRAVKFFSLSSSMVGVIGQPFLYSAIVSTGSVPVIIGAYSFIGFFTLVTPLLLHFITKKYVTQLFYKPATDSYIAKTVNFFCIARETEFKVDDVKVPDVPGMFTTLLANGKPLFFDPRFFENPDHYARIMGYDKPIDFKLYESPPIEKKD